MKFLKRIICFLLVILTATYCLVQCYYEYSKREEIELYEELNRRWDLNFSSNLIQYQKYGIIDFDARGNVYRILEVNQNDSILDNLVNERNERFEKTFIEELNFIEEFENVIIDQEYIPTFDKEYRYFSKKKHALKIEDNDLLDKEILTSYLYVFHYIEDPNILYFIENV